MSHGTTTLTVWCAVCGAEVAPGIHRRRLTVVVAAGAAMVLAASLAVALWPRDDGTNADVSTPPCAVADDSSSSRIGLAAEPIGTYTLADGTNRRVGYMVTALRAQ